MKIIDKRTDNAIALKKIPAGKIFFSVEDDIEELFMKISRERLRQAIKDEMEICYGEMAYEFAVRLEDGLICKINSDKQCHILENVELIIKN